MTPPSPSPVEVHDPIVRDSFKQAAVWLGLAAALFLAWQLAGALLLIVGGLVFAALLDLGSRSLARVWNGPRWLRLTIVVLVILAAIGGFLAVAGVQLAEQAGELSRTLTLQVQRLSKLLESYGIAQIVGNEGRGPLAGIASQIIGSFGKLTQALGTAAGAIGSFVLIMVLGVYIAAEPRLYERGVEWLTPMRSRSSIAELVAHSAETLRRWTLGRLISMLFDGVFTTVALLVAGVPLAPLLGLIAGVLAFIPNIGAFIAGTLIVLVGFSAGTTTGIAALGVYLALQFIEGNFITPFVERRTVDVAPAVGIAAQLLFGALFGLLGVALAVPIVAVAKVVLEHRRASAAPQSRGIGRGWTTSDNDLEASTRPT
jgi:predicted PurR-regulated permease PerM